MPRVTVPDKTVGDVFTEQMWDAYIRDNFNIGSFTPIADSIPGGAVANFDFQSIPATFASLMLIVYARGDSAANFANLNLRVNNDAGSTYDFQVLTANSTTLTGVGTAAGTGGAQIGRVPAGTAPASAEGCTIVTIPNYTNSSAHKPYLSWAVNREVSGVAGDNVLALIGGIWLSTAAINRLTLLLSAGNFAASSRATLYGIPYI